jgi:hypothetical protein
MPSTPTLSELAAEWRHRAELLTQYGDPNTARLWRLAADELDRAVAAEREATLTLKAASERSGYSVDHLADLIRRGVLPNAGRKGAPRLQIRDLPASKATVATPSPAATAADDAFARGRRARHG